MSSSFTTPNPFVPKMEGRTERGSVSSRTHRVVRERARALQAQRSRNRALLVPMIVASSLVLIFISAFWIMFDEYEVGNAVQDARFHLPILLIWFFPVTGALLIIALLRKLRSASDREDTR